MVGTSLGSLIAQAFAENWPERTRRLVLQSSSGGPLAACESEPAGEAVFDFRSAILALQDPIDPESQFMIAWYASTVPVDAEFLRRQRRDAAAIPVRVWLAILDQGLNLRDLQADLQRIRAPTLLIWGGMDNLFGARDRCSLQKALPQAEVRLFEKLGHNAYWEDPRAVASVDQSVSRREVTRGPRGASTAAAGPRVTLRHAEAAARRSEAARSDPDSTSKSAAAT